MKGRGAALLSNTQLFGTMSDDARQRLSAGAVQRSYIRGEVIFREDDPSDALSVVVTGLVKIYLTSVDGDKMLR